uniref:TLC domain-containing protein n=1 Tax=Haemonchus placei TaxID=6290 RepID=A0A0N4X403_HAEPC
LKAWCFRMFDGRMNSNFPLFDAGIFAYSTLVRSSATVHCFHMILDTVLIEGNHQSTCTTLYWGIQIAFIDYCIPFRGGVSKFGLRLFLAILFYCRKNICVLMCPVYGGIAMGEVALSFGHGNRITVITRYFTLKFRM